MRFLVNFPKDQPKARTRKQHNFSPDRPDIAEFKTKANSAIFITFHHFHYAADSMRNAARLIFIVSFGEPGGTRTRDPLIKSLREPLPLFAPVSIIQ